MAAQNPVRDQEADEWFQTARLQDMLRNDNVEPAIVAALPRKSPAHRLVSRRIAVATLVVLAAAASVTIALTASGNSRPVNHQVGDSGSTSTSTPTTAAGPSTTGVSGTTAPESTNPAYNPNVPVGTMPPGCHQLSDGEVLSMIRVAYAQAQKVLPQQHLPFSSVGGTWAPAECKVSLLVYGVNDTDRPAVIAALQRVLGSGYYITTSSAYISPLAKH